MSNIVKKCFSLDMPSDLWRKRVTKFESKFIDFYVKVMLLLPCFGEIKMYKNDYTGA